MQRIKPCLWFDDQAEEAAKFYTSIFKRSRLGKIARYDAASAKAAGRPAGSVLTVEFRLDGEEFLALNGGPMFKFSEAVSFMVSCRTQAEVDYYWERLSAGGQVQQCGWLKDKFGVSWQIVPTALGRLISDRDPAKSRRVMTALLQMVKLDIKKLKAAHAGK
jgi:predicted 3-demethylubiquinone-9 3-methyltransferase (glyoxalase superfamily)